MKSNFFRIKILYFLCIFVVNCQQDPNDPLLVYTKNGMLRGIIEDINLLPNNKFQLFAWLGEIKMNNFF